MHDTQPEEMPTDEQPTSGIFLDHDAVLANAEPIEVAAGALAGKNRTDHVVNDNGVIEVV